ncbi:MAG: TIGR01777 family protein [Gemmatimonadales bacterium]|nr:TIGR01777 family protein [Gemmatimonadales bacterium]
MRIAVTGATGLVGTALGTFLRKAGHVVIPISRSPAPGGVRWDPARGQLDADELAGVDAVVHLAGENIAAERWTADRKQELRVSRVGPTGLLARTIAGMKQKPSVLVSASAVGIYGEHGDAMVDETTPPADDFLGRLAVAWEAAAQPARDAGIRVVHPRIATVLAPDGGALEKMLPFFRAGLGGPLAGGRHWMPWVAITDLVRAIQLLLERTDLAGPFNVVAPGIVRNSEFTAALGAAVNRPAIIPVPRFALTLLYGELADAALLTSTRVAPARLEAAGFRFELPDIETALAVVT